jgi:hypothetical protein
MAKKTALTIHTVGGIGSWGSDTNQPLGFAAEVSILKRLTEIFVRRKQEGRGQQNLNNEAANHLGVPLPDG